MLFFTLYQVAKTYALFESNKNYQISNDIAKWIIDINNSSIPSTNTFTIDKITYTESEYIINNKIAPGLCGYFDIQLNSSKSEVSVRYDISLDTTAIEDTSININQVKELNNKELILSAKNTYTGIIKLKDEDKTHTLRVNVCWDNNEDYNNKDSEIGLKTDGTINLIVNITLTQYLNEEIPTHVEE